MAKQFEALLIDVQEDEATLFQATTAATFYKDRLVTDEYSESEITRWVRSRRPEMVVFGVRSSHDRWKAIIGGLDLAPVPAIIILADDDEAAPEAFAASAVDYLVRPVSAQRLRLALERAQRWITLPGEDRSEPPGACPAIEESAVSGAVVDPADEGIWIKTHGSGYVRVTRDVIRYVTAEDDYVCIHLEDRSLLMRETLKRLHVRLGADMFLRVHRSTIVNVEAVAEFRTIRGKGLNVVLSDGTLLKVGRICAKRLRRAQGALERRAKEGVETRILGGTIPSET